MVRNMFAQIWLKYASNMVTNMAQIWREYGQGYGFKDMARIWLEYGQNMHQICLSDRIWSGYGQDMVRIWWIYMDIVDML